MCPTCKLLVPATFQVDKLTFVDYLVEDVLVIKCSYCSSTIGFPHQEVDKIKKVREQAEYDAHRQDEKHGA